MLSIRFTTISYTQSFDFEDIAEERAEKVFQQLDVNDDGELNEEEFVSGALKVMEERLTKNNPMIKTNKTKALKVEWKGVCVQSPDGKTQRKIFNFYCNCFKHSIF